MVVGPLGEEVVTVTLDRPGSDSVPAFPSLFDDMRPDTERGGAPESDPWAEDEELRIARAEASE